MPRARNIKHSFFTNDALAEHNEPLGRLLFIGLWTLADYKGELEWRPARIKSQILPYDDCDINELGINLDKTGFIRFYSVQTFLYAKVVNFAEHQHPHQNEKKRGSKIPEFDEPSRQLIDFNTLTINPDKSGLKPEDSESDRADSCILIPDSLSTLTGVWFTPEKETLEYLIARQLPFPTEANIAAFESHHDQKKTHFIDDRSRQAAFRKWMAQEKTFSENNKKRGSNGFSSNKSKSEQHLDAVRDL